MRTLAADLHIHSCLSPCADMLMTPNNIVNMARLKGLEAIAVCDHNSARNLPACKKVADAAGLLLIPGIEAETREEVHVLCYLPTLEAACALGELIYAHLPARANLPDFFGEQAVMDENDDIVAYEERLLIQSTDLSIGALSALCRDLGGVPVPAHINRTSNSVLYNLGFIPEDVAFTSVEVCRTLPMPPGMDLGRYHVLASSDAHDLSAILERESFLSLGEATVEAMLAYLAQRK